MKNIAVFYGGKSVEHDISIITALQVMKSFPRKYNLIPIYVRPDGSFVTAKNLTDAKVYLNYKKLAKDEMKIIFAPGNGEINIAKNNKLKKTIKIDCAVICNHGHGGEDGALQGLLELSEIPYTSCAVPSSAITMDKVLTKVMLESENILSPTYVYFSKCEFDNKREDALDKIKTKISYPCIVKPARLGSSVGINICENEDMIISTIENAFLFDDKIIVEKYIKNAREFCVGVLSSAGKIFPSKVQEVYKGDFFTFEEKYLNKKEAQHEKLSKEFEKKIKNIAAETYKILECSGVVRVDFLYDEKNDKIFVNEVNSIPGSLAFNLFDTKFEDLIVTLVEEAEERHKNRQKISYKFASNAIEKYIQLSNGQKGNKL